jgi:hypothetical protein
VHPLARLANPWPQLRQTHLAPIEWQVRPCVALSVDELRSDLPMGPPAWAPDFNSADLPLMMRLADLPARDRRHFLAA